MVSDISYWPHENLYLYEYLCPGLSKANSEDLFNLDLEYDLENMKRILF